MTPYHLVFQYDPFDMDSRLILTTSIGNEVETHIIPTNDMPALVEKIAELDTLCAISRILIVAPPFYYEELSEQVPDNIKERMERI